MCDPGGGLGYSWRVTCWGCQDIIRETWPQTIVVHRVGKDATFLVVVFDRSRSLCAPPQEAKLSDPTNPSLFKVAIKICRPYYHCVPSLFSLTSVQVRVLKEKAYSAYRKRRLNSPQNPDRGLERSPHRATKLCTPGVLHAAVVRL